jgi:hypothetical protein
MIQFERNADADLKACDEATPGPWRAVQSATHMDVKAPHQNVRSVARVYDDIDAVFIAMARDALPAWIRRAVAAEEEVLKLRQKNDLG